ncbi:unnamed protein product [Callosobruchus maculatus]|uniref:Uncharacterized protein n=1 Tax=Callosobruchus maculatus TaxID=64391 RepID=A0A653BJU9_CALMS|nr:unnamed protein product [Callosobruchus maculatus]
MYFHVLTLLNFSSGNYVAPEGISIAIPIIYIHRCPSYWKDPLKFDPVRFLPDNVAKRLHALFLRHKKLHWLAICNDESDNIYSSC